MNLEWINYIQKKEEEDVQTKSEELTKARRSRRSSTGDSQTSDTEDQD